jgi:hypothetical protein
MVKSLTSGQKVAACSFYHGCGVVTQNLQLLNF